MSVLNGFKLAAIVSILAVALSTPAWSESPPTQAVAKYKAQLAAAAASAKPVAVREEKAPADTGLAPQQSVTAIDESDLQDLEPAPPVAQDAEETQPLRVSLDKPEIVRLDRDAINVIVGSNENLRVVPDTNKTLVLIAKKPGSTYFRALDVDGKVIMQRHVIIGSPTKNYIRIRRACANGAEGCKQYSVYYCPDICHEVNVVQDATGPSAAVPDATPASARQEKPQASSGDGQAPESQSSEPPPGE